MHGDATNQPKLIGFDTIVNKPSYNTTLGPWFYIDLGCDNHTVISVPNTWGKPLSHSHLFSFFEENDFSLILGASFSILIVL